MSPKSQLLSRQLMNNSSSPVIMRCWCVANKHFLSTNNVLHYPLRQAFVSFFCLGFFGEMPYVTTRTCLAARKYALYPTVSEQFVEYACIVDGRTVCPNYQNTPFIPTPVNPTSNI